jgi:tetratricopeptide (TPR) repeat protein
MSGHNIHILAQLVDKLKIFYILVHMQPNVAALAKKAIEAALKSDWNKSIQLNLEILEKNPGDKDAKLRLGRAYIQTKKFSKARKIFSEILKVDPINQIAQKNLKLAQEEHATPTSSNGTLDARALIKEPGTSIEATAKITSKNFLPEDLNPGEELSLKVKKTGIELKAKGSSGKSMGTITDAEIISRAYVACQKNAKLHASVIKSSQDKIIVLLKCSIPTFKSQRQDVKPYVKKGTIAEPKLETGELD